MTTETANQFVLLVRDRKISNPGTKGFSVEAWDLEYERYGRSDADQRVHGAGRIIGSRLLELWKSVDETGLTSHPAEVVTYYLALSANKSFATARDFLSEALAQQSVLPMGAAGHLRIAYRVGDISSYDAVITSTIDVWSRMLKAVIAMGSTSSNRTADLATAVQAAFSLFSEIYQVEFFWGRVLWQGWALKEHDDVWSFQPAPDSDVEANYAIAEWRRNLEEGEFAVHYQQQWDQGEDLERAVQVEAVNRSGRLEYQLKIHGPGIDPMPAGLPPRKRLESSELALVLFDRLGKGDNAFTLEQLLAAWDLLSSACVSASQFVLNGKVALSALAMSHSFLDELLAGFDFEPEKREAMINFLTFSETSVDGLWGKPLVRINADQYIPILPSFVEQNLYRQCEQWLSSAKADDVLRNRGARFEEAIRKRCTQEIPKAVTIEDFHVVTENWKPAVGDIDLAFRIDSTIFIAELKFRKFPTIPVEIGQYMKELRHASAQLDARMSFIRSNLKAAAQKTRYRGEVKDLHVVGFIMTATQFGAGLTVNGYPVIDSDLFFEFFYLQRFAAMLDPNDDLADPASWQSDLSLPLLTGDLDLDLRRHLQDPLRVRYAAFGLDTHDRSIPIGPNEDRTLNWREVSIDASKLIGPRGVEVFAKLKEFDSMLRCKQSGSRGSQL
ncbi:hypothetical protein ASC97_23535 [Rhizobium sp. Root1203]|uniref:hypothetical protein n=1 Tax=Rhizobium sp. Root1203 TaxID=1736427 RepID=UPI00070C52D3|nr:hypothetical protein [Rhizobium sp. Root1203]KQV29311.1 hypothetical protein ASC97_23535 [Rhizobium sp. Root1203]